MLNDHVLTVLINSCTEDGEPLSDAKIRDQVVSLIVSSYETTSGAMAWAIYALLSTPGAWDTTTELTVMLARRLARTSQRLLDQHVRASGFAGPMGPKFMKIAGAEGLSTGPPRCCR